MDQKCPLSQQKMSLSWQRCCECNLQWTLSAWAPSDSISTADQCRNRARPHHRLQQALPEGACPSSSTYILVRLYHLRNNCAHAHTAYATAFWFTQELMCLLPVILQAISADIIYWCGNWLEAMTQEILAGPAEHHLQPSKLHSSHRGGDTEEAGHLRPRQGIWCHHFGCGKDTFPFCLLTWATSILDE